MGPWPGATAMAPLGPASPPRDPGTGNLPDRPKDMDGRKALVADTTFAERCCEPFEVALDDRRGHDALRPRRVAQVNDLARQREHDRDRGNARRPGSNQERPPGVYLHIRGIDDDKPARSQAANDLAMKDRERCPRPALVRLVAAQQEPVRVGGENIGRIEMTRRERRLPRTGRPDQYDERRIRDLDRSRAVRRPGRSSAYAADPALPTVGRAPPADRAASASATRLSSAYV